MATDGNSAGKKKNEYFKYYGYRIYDKNFKIELPSRPILPRKDKCALGDRRSVQCTAWTYLHCVDMNFTESYCHHVTPKEPGNVIVSDLEDFSYEEPFDPDEPHTVPVDKIFRIEFLNIVQIPKKYSTCNRLKNAGKIVKCVSKKTGRKISALIAVQRSNLDYTMAPKYWEMERVIFTRNKGRWEVNEYPKK
ncbi:MAG: hypothetical protein HQL65_14170 [Magnetococcales bacterium]|nr:hypothetical protein [Magnetococcales bacterium]